MKHVPSVPAAKAQGQTMLGADGNMYHSQKNKKTQRWRWVLVASHAAPTKPRKGLVKSQTAAETHELSITSEPKPKVKAQIEHVRIPTGSDSKLRQWRLSPAPSALNALPTMTPELERTLRANGITHLGSLYSQVFTSGGDFVKFLKAMRDLGLDEASSELIFDKFAGQVATDQADTAVQPEPLAVEQDLVAALNAVPQFQKLYEIVKPKRPHPDGFRFAVGVGGQALVFEGKYNANGTKLAIKIEYGENQALNKELNLMARIKETEPKAKHVNFPIDAFALPRHLTNLKYNAFAVVSPFLAGCNRFEKAAERDLASVLRGCAQALYEVHRAGIVHRDVTPNNFCVDTETGQVTIIDFGLAALLKHKQQREPSFFGTPRFAALAAHLKKPQGFRDDLEALAYTVYKPLTGKELPWATAPAGSSEASQEKSRIKGKTKPPAEIRDYIARCRALSIDEMPDRYPEFVSLLLLEQTESD
jgi:hypothetical protein